MGIAWMDRGIGAEREFRRNGSNTTARLSCLASISTIKRHKPTSRPSVFMLIFLLTVSQQIT